MTMRLLTLGLAVNPTTYRQNGPRRFTATSNAWPNGATRARQRRVRPGAAPRPQKNTNVRDSMLSRGGASGGLVGSSKAVWMVKRARPSSAES